MSSTCERAHSPDIETTMCCTCYCPSNCQTHSCNVWDTIVNCCRDISMAITRPSCVRTSTGEVPGLDRPAFSYSNSSLKICQKNIPPHSVSCLYFSVSTDDVPDMDEGSVQPDINNNDRLDIDDLLFMTLPYKTWTNDEGRAETLV